jgi:hypothetical protein
MEVGSGPTTGDLRALKGKGVGWGGVWQGMGFLVSSAFWLVGRSEPWKLRVLFRLPPRASLIISVPPPPPLLCYNYDI